MFSILKKNIIFLLMITTLISFTACSGDKITDPKDHFVPIGTVIYDATGAEVFRIIKGATTDTLYTEVGVLSDHYNVKFINDDEQVVNPPDDDDLSMGIDITDPNLLEIEQDEPGEFEFHLMGLSEGLTTIEIKILHGNHADYRSGLIPVKITN